MGMIITPAQSWPARYPLLDGVRGLACLGVLSHHLQILPIGHYCVMLFFVVSGYCITASADSCLRRGLSFRAFMYRRVRRIYPPYLFAVAFFVATRVLKGWLMGSGAWHANWIAWVQNVTLTQWVSDLFHPVSWPAQNSTLFVSAFWSLNYEEQFYLVMGLALALACRSVVRVQTTVLVLLILGLTWDLAHPSGPLFGFFIEYWPHFALGACLYAVLCKSTGRPAYWGFISAVLVLGIYSSAHLLPLTRWSDETHVRLYLELSVLSAAALALLALRPYSDAICRAKVWLPIAGLGAISYSLYLVHQFNLVLVQSLAERILPSTAPHALLIASMVAMHLAIATSFWRLFERPFLNRKPDDRI